MSDVQPVKAKPPARKAPPKGVPMTSEGRLGVMARDVVTGLEGIVACKTEMLNGNVQLGIQPKGKGDKIEEAHFIDWHTLEVIGEGIADKVPPIDRSPTIKLGQRVFDRVSGMTGIAVERTTFLNGCVYFAVQGPYRKEQLLGDLSQPVRFPHQRLESYRTLGELIAALLRALLPAPQARQEPALPAPREEPIARPAYQRPPGGPSRSTRSMRTC
jgi:hypothetical protein